MNPYCPKWRSKVKARDLYSFHNLARVRHGPLSVTRSIWNETLPAGRRPQALKPIPVLGPVVCRDPGSRAPTSRHT